MWVRLVPRPKESGPRVKLGPNRSGHSPCSTMAAGTIISVTRTPVFFVVSDVAQWTSDIELLK